MSILLTYNNEKNISNFYKINKNVIYNSIIKIF